MKKFIFTMLVTSNLFAMDPTTISRPELSSEQQTGMLNTRPDGPHIETMEDQLYHDLCSVSRNAYLGTERAAAEKLRRQLSTDKIKIEEVRIIDSYSYISGLDLNEDDRRSFLTALTSDKKLYEKIDDFCRDFRFVNIPTQLFDAITSGAVELPRDLETDESLKADVEFYMVNNSKKSLVYRNLIVSYLARVKASNFVSTRSFFPHQFEHKLIASGEKWRFYVSSGIVCCADLPTILCRSVFPSSLFGEHYPEHFPVSNSMIFFHEAGHAIDFFSEAAQYLRMNSTEHISSGLLDVKADMEIFRKHQSEILEMFRDPELLSYLKQRFVIREDQDLTLEFVGELIKSPDFLANYLLDDSTEIWQIMGTALIKYGNKYTLYVNKMSDFALSCNLGLSVRCDHLGMYFPDYVKSLSNERTERNSLKNLFKYQAPLDVYSPLMELHGPSVQEYIFKSMYCSSPLVEPHGIGVQECALRLMYPNGLISQLQIEYRLGSNLIALLKSLKEDNLPDLELTDLITKTENRADGNFSDLTSS